MLRTQNGQPQYFEFFELPPSYCFGKKDLVDLAIEVHVESPGTAFVVTLLDVAFILIPYN